MNKGTKDIPQVHPAKAMIHQHRYCSQPLDIYRLHMAIIRLIDERNEARKLARDICARAEDQCYREDAAMLALWEKEEASEGVDEYIIQ